MKFQALMAAICLTLAAGCDGPKKTGAAPDDMAGMQMPAPAPAPIASGPAVTVGDITVSDAWAPVTPTGARVAAGYLTIKNAGAVDDKLLSASSSRAKTVELHEMLNENGMMTMRQVKELTLKPGEEVKLEPGKLHLMLIDPALPYADGEMAPVTLTFEKAGQLEVQMLVRPRDASVDEHGGH